MAAKKNSRDYIDNSEQFLFDLFTTPQSQQEEAVRAVLENNPPWPLLYHLSPARQALLSWFPFKKGASLLEVGAGCGALTGMLCEKVEQVYANELTTLRSNVIKRRYKDRANLIISSGNIFGKRFNRRFDYVTSIGVLEYAGRYTKHASDAFYDPYLLLLQQMKTLLSDNGTLLLAIENRLGLKYLAGGREDHLGSLFSSIENYPHYSGIRTFTKSELTNLLHAAGFSRLTFYYPLPDYKLPATILTDAYFTVGGNLPASLYGQIVDYSNPRVPLYDEISLTAALVKEKNFGNFANSFLVEATL